MRSELAMLVLAAGLTAVPHPTLAQTAAAPAQAAPAPAGDSVIVVEKPTYTSITLETTVNRATTRQLRATPAARPPHRPGSASPRRARSSAPRPGAGRCAG